MPSQNVHIYNVALDLLLNISLNSRPIILFPCINEYNPLRFGHGIHSLNFTGNVQVHFCTLVAEITLLASFTTSAVEATNCLFFFSVYQCTVHS